MVVYIVKELQNEKQLGREIESIWLSYDKAAAHVEELKNKHIHFWDGSVVDKYIINSYRVEE